MDNAEETLKLAIEIRERTSNLILTLSTGAVGYVVFITNDSPLSGGLLFIGLAVIAWGQSILYGLQYSAHLNDMSLALGASFIALRKGDSKEIAKTQKESIDIEILGSKKMNYQKIAFFIGVVFFIAWRIIKLF